MLRRLNIGFLFPLAALAFLVIVLSSQMFNISPLGKLLDPFIGVAKNGRDSRLDADRIVLKKSGLLDSVEIFFDERKVPHVFAANSADLYFAQGYVTASLRLWQMDFTSYVAAGRLSEIFSGPEFLEHDRNQRRIGVPEAAENSLRFIEKDQETITALNAYTSGVNAYISELEYSNMPVEYKLLDYRPEPWTNLKSLLIQKNVAVNLTGYGEDLLMSRMMVALGAEKFNLLFPGLQPGAVPIVGNASGVPSAAFASLQQPAYLNYGFLAAPVLLPSGNYNPRLGSNSWAVSGKKTKTGYPLLASDPHLNLTLPAVWLEMQLSAPDLNVYGVSIPGTPAVIIGFNRQIAWGLTNGADDVKDWYKLKVSPGYKKYLLDGRWLDLKMRIDTIRRRGRGDYLDTVYSTVHGPIVSGATFAGPDVDIQHHALRWEMHRPSNEFITFIKLSQARNFDDYKKAIRGYTCPLQNFTFACNDNTIAINHQGNMAVKWPGQGRFILDGTRSDHIPNRYIPFDSLPQQVNPASNYVFSANQQPTTAAYPYYYCGHYSESRANRIQNLLDRDSLYDMAAMQAMQLDNVNYNAVSAVPLLVAATNKEKLNAEQQSLLAAISAWKGGFDANDPIARLFDIWWKFSTDATWDEFAGYRFFTRTPHDNVLISLLATDSANSYFDKLATAEKETSFDIVTAAFVKASNEYIQLKQRGQNMNWGNIHRVNLMHMTNIPAFSKMNIPAPGHPDAINAVDANWGPSWRMVVQLGERPVAMGIYPGGQSGHPGTRYYDNFVSDWNMGKYYPLHFYIDKKEAEAAGGSVWILNKK